MDILTGLHVGRYRLEERLGRGGMAEVYKARDEKLGRAVAVKMILTEFLSDSHFLERFMREAQVVAQLDHPNILPVYDFGEHEGRPYLVMPFLDGGSLAERMVGAPANLPMAVSWISQLAEALDAAHEAGVLHRDVKPANVLIGKGDRLYLADFGIARMLESAKGLTVTGTVVGTPTYMAPETATGRTAVPASDRYALAVIAFELLTGAPPYTGDSALSVLHQHVTAPIPVLSSATLAFPSALDRVVGKGLAKDPAKRHSSCREFADEFRDAALGTIPASVPASPPTANWAEKAETERKATSAPVRKIAALTPAGKADPGLTSAATVATRSEGSMKSRAWIPAAIIAVVALGVFGVIFMGQRDKPVKVSTAVPKPVFSPGGNPVPVVEPTPPAPSKPKEEAHEPRVQELAPPGPHAPPPPPVRAGEDEARQAFPPPPPPADGSPPVEDSKAVLEMRVVEISKRFIPMENPGFRPSKRDFEEARDVAKEVLNESPQNHEAQALRRYAHGGLAYLDSGLPEARQILEEILKRKVLPLPLLSVRAWARGGHDLPDWMVALVYLDPKREAAGLLASADAASDPRVAEGVQMLRVIGGAPSSEPTPVRGQPRRPFRLRERLFRDRPSGT